MYLIIIKISRLNLSIIKFKISHNSLSTSQPSSPKPSLQNKPKTHTPNTHETKQRPQHQTRKKPKKKSISKNFKYPF